MAPELDKTVLLLPQSATPRQWTKKNDRQNHRAASALIAANDLGTPLAESRLSGDRRIACKCRKQSVK